MLSGPTTDKDFNAMQDTVQNALRLLNEYFKQHFTSRSPLPLPRASIASAWNTVIFSPCLSLGTLSPTVS